MDSRLALLKDFSSTFIEGKAKIETELFGFEFLSQLLSGGGALEYGEMTDTRLLHKFKITGIPAHRMDELYTLHLQKQFNVCRYFGPQKNDVLCFNLDNNHRTENTTIIPELATALDTLRTVLSNLGCEPLILASGRGYHVWLRFDEPVDNALLYQFMIAAAAQALRPIMARGDDHRAVKFSFYPDINIVDSVSLRLFGSDHAKNGTFSQVVTQEGLLGEEASWKCFEEFVRSGAMRASALLNLLSKSGPAVRP